MTVVTVLAPYKDAQGNEIVYDGPEINRHVKISFTGANNKLTVATNAKVVTLSADFASSDGYAEIGPTSQPRTGLRLALRIGHRSSIRIGENVGTANRTFISAVEGTSVLLGDDCMIASQVEIRTDDAHPFYDIRSRKRLNVSQSITIGEHVWVAKFAAIMGGVSIGDGSIIGYRSIVTRNIPNNVVAVGAPAKVVRKNIAWGRPTLRVREVGSPGPTKREQIDKYWQPTNEDSPDPAHVGPSVRRLKQPFWMRFLPKHS